MDAWRARSRADPSPVASVGTSVALALVVGAGAVLMFASDRAGHWWGDDWALYIRQAEAFLDGEPRRVLDENRFAVEVSRGAAFSPPLYPWGYPLLLVPFVAVVGADVDDLMVVQVLAAAVFACCWYALARPRLGTLPALVGVPAVTLTPLLLGWSELIQSEWPFLAVSGVALVALDRVAAAGALATPAARLGPLIGLGVGAAAAFSVRREGLAMVAAVAAAQLAALIATRAAIPWRDATARRALAIRLLTPHLAALATVIVVQILLPSTLVPRYDGTGLHNIWEFAAEHAHHLAEVSGIKRPWDDQAVVLGSTVLGRIAVGAYLAGGLAGIVLAATRFRTRDLHLAAYALVAFAIGGSFRVAINRYVATVGPLLLLLGLVALAWMVRQVGGDGPRARRFGTAVVTIVVAGLVAGNLAHAHRRWERAGDFADAGRVEWGPTHPDAIAMFDAVRDRSEPDDIVAAPKARAMTLATDRLAVQVDDHRPLPPDVELALVVVEPDSSLADELDAAPDYAAVWSNGRFTIYAPVG